MNICNHGQKIRGKVLFSCEVEHYGKISTSIFQQIFAIIDKTFYLGRTVGTTL